LTFQERKSKNINNSLRKAEVRLKIQLGGLVLKSRITDLLAITPGDDLQLDPTKWQAAAVILGALTEAYEKLQLDQDQALYNQWAFLGSKLLRYEYKNKR
jgi:hypothetical protein